MLVSDLKAKESSSPILISRAPFQEPGLLSCLYKELPFLLVPPYRWKQQLGGAYLFRVPHLKTGDLEV